MANSNYVAMIINFVFLVALLVIVSMAESGESRLLIGIIRNHPICNTVYGVASGDTCFDVANMFNLSSTFFESINPNVACHSLFVGQWLCVAGTA